MYPRISSVAIGGSVEFLRQFHVERFKGGMNRLLLRAHPTSVDPARVEVLFQYAHRLDIPMRFDGLVVEDATATDNVTEPWSSLLVVYPECRVFRLLSHGQIVGRVLAAACAYGEDAEVSSAPSMFPMMA